MIWSKIKKVRKRSGRIVDFDADRITSAIFKAVKATIGKEHYDFAEKLSGLVIEELNQRFVGKIPTVEEIQDIIEKVLIENAPTQTAKAYIIYRKQHEELRALGEQLSSSEIVESYLAQKDWRVKENANMEFSLQGLNAFVSSTIISNYWLRKLYPPAISEAHRDGDIHIHDAGVLGPYCMGWDLKDLLSVGFRGAPGKITSAPAKHFRSALIQCVNFLYTLQGESAGAQAFSNVDTLLAPYIRADGLSYKEVKQCVQELLFNMNVPTRVGFQTPFTNFTLDIKPPAFMCNEAAYIAGREEGTYGDYVEEMTMFNKAFFETMITGDATGRVFTFPIPTYNITRDFSWDGEIAEGLFEMTAKFGIPYFANFINTDMRPEDVRSMCCRLRLDKRELVKRGGGLFGANPLTGAQGVVTINMPRIGYLSRDDSEFFGRLETLLELARDALEIRRKVIERFTEQGLYPYTRFYLRSIKEAFGAYWKNHFSTIGLIGMNEALLNFMNVSIVEPEGRGFAIKVLDFMRRKIADFQEETGSLFNLEATPGEGASYRLARLDKQKYSDIRVANDEVVKSGAAPFYTNSTQLPVDYQCDLFEALELQEELQIRYTGGTVFHAFLGERLHSWRSAREIVRKVMHNFRIPYFTLTPTFSICPKHGYLPGEHEWCPRCDEEIGYVATTAQPLKATALGAVAAQVLARSV